MAEAAAMENRGETSPRGKVWSRGSPSWSGPFGLFKYLGPLPWLFHYKWQAGGLPTCPTAAAVGSGLTRSGEADGPHVSMTIANQRSASRQHTFKTDQAT